MLVFEREDEIVETLLAFARGERIGAATLTGLGAFREATLAYFDRGRHDYVPIPVHEQVEVASLLGNIGRQDGEPRAHLHGVLGRPDGSALAGHVLDGRVWPTLEVVLVEGEGELRRAIDEETGVPLLAPDG